MLIDSNLDKIIKGGRKKVLPKIKDHLINWKLQIWLMKKPLLFAELVKTYIKSLFVQYFSKSMSKDETNSFVGYSRRSDFINNVGKTHSVTND